MSYLPHQTVARQLPVHLAAAPGAVSNGYPPYGVHEFPSASGRLPVHRTDVGALLLADAFGAASCVSVRDTEAMAPLEGRERVSADELAGTKGDLPLDRLALERLTRTKHVREIRIVDGTGRGQLTAALTGNPAGTTVEA